MFEKRGVSAKVISIILTVVIIGLIVLAGPAEAFTLNLSSSTPSVNVGEEISFIAELNIAEGELLPVEYLELSVGGVLCRFDVDGTNISGCAGLGIVRIEDANSTYGNFSGNFSGTEYNFGYGYGYGYGGAGRLAYNITLDSTVLGTGEHPTLLRAKMTDEDAFVFDGNNVTVLPSGNETFVPVVISNESVDPVCALEDDEITLYADVTGSIELVQIDLNYNNGTFYTVNLSGTSEGTYAYTLNASDVGAGNTLTWEFVVRDTQGGDNFGVPTNSVRVNSMTHLSVVPSPANGDRGWYVTEPNFTLSNPDGNISYSWDGGDFQNYSGSFGLEGIQNSSEGGVHVLHYKSDVCSEATKQFSSKFDFADPEITIVSPLDGAVINESAGLIEANIDDPYNNSGVNESSIKLLLDGSFVSFTLGGSGEVTHAFSNLSNGLHNVNLSASDNAGRSSEVGWSFSVNVTLPEPEPNLVIYKPTTGVYNNRRVQFNITTVDESARLVYINDNENNPRERLLCRNCDEYGLTRKKLVSLKEGENNLTIIAINQTGGHEEEGVSVFVDSVEPRIRKAEPTRGFTDGNFFIDFEELNPVQVLLHYGNTQSGQRIQNVNISECDLDRTYECNVEVNLTDYEAEEINYFFEVIDVANNTDHSRTRTLDVDLTDPVINSFEGDVDGKRIEFTLDISELNFDRVTYVDLMDPRLKEKTVCTRLNNRICTKRISFADGQHDLVFKVSDEAGNYETRNFSVFIDSIDPRILSAEPRRGNTTGEFYVRFKETNPLFLVLNYGNGPTGMNSSDVDMSQDCFFNGRDYECNTSVNLTAYDGQEISYWFVLTDVAGQTDESPVREVTVDL